MHVVSSNLHQIQVRKNVQSVRLRGNNTLVPKGEGFIDASGFLQDLKDSDGETRGRGQYFVLLTTLTACRDLKLGI